MGDMTDSGINMTDVLDPDNDSKIETDSGKVNVEVVITNCTAATTSLSTEGNESSNNHLQVPTNTISIDCTQDIHSNSNKTGSRGSMLSISSFLDDALTPKQVTKVIKCRLMATLTIAIITVILLFLVPVVLYNIKSPTTELYSFDDVAFENVNFDTCSVSSIYTQ